MYVFRVYRNIETEGTFCIFLIFETWHFLMALVWFHVQHLKGCVSYNRNQCMKVLVFFGTFCQLDSFAKKKIFLYIYHEEYPWKLSCFNDSFFKSFYNTYSLKTCWTSQMVLILGCDLNSSHLIGNDNTYQEICQWMPKLRFL